MAVPQQGKYRVVRRSRGLRTPVGGVVDSSTISPLLLLALVRTRCLELMKAAPAAVPEPVVTEPEPEEIKDPDPAPKHKPRKWSNKK